MFGETVDYWLLKSLAHRRNLATEAELDGHITGIDVLPRSVSSRIAVSGIGSERSSSRENRGLSQPSIVGLLRRSARTTKARRKPMNP